MKSVITSVKFWLALLATLVFGLGVSVKAAGNATLVITSPIEGQKIVGNTVPVDFSVNNFTLVDFRVHPKSARGQGHLHLWLDQAKNDPMSAIKIFADTYTFEGVRPGLHTLVAELVNNDHSSLVPPVRTTVTFTTQDSEVVAQNSLLSSPFLIAILAFLFIIVVLYFITNQAKSGLRTSKKPQKSSPKSSKR